MKSLHTLIALLLLGTSLFAQKVDLDGEPLPVQYLRLPDRPLPAAYQFYSVIVSSKPGDLAAMGVSEGTLLKYANVPGYKKIEKGGHFNLEITVEDFKYIGGPESKVETVVTKDKSGKEIKNYTYQNTIKYTQPITLRVRNEESKELLKRTWLEGEREYKSEKYGTKKEADDFVKNDLRRAVAKQVQGDILSSMSQMQNLLGEQYGYPAQKGEIKLEILDSDKHPDYAGFQGAYATAKKAFGGMQSDAPLDAVKTGVQPAVEYFDQQKDKYDVSEKSGKKLKYACLYDLALIHFWLEDFDKAATYAAAVVANDYEPKSGKRLLEDIDEMKASMQKCGHNTRHFTIEIDTSALPAATETVYDSDKSLRVEAYKDQKKGIGSNTVETPGVVYYKDGTEAHGTFLMDGPQRTFDDKSNTRFSVETAQNAYVSVPDYKKVSRFTIGDKLYRVLPFKSANTASLGSKADVQIMEVLYESPKIAAYLAYTGDSRGLNNPAEYVIHKIAENDMTSLSSFKFALNINKGIRKEYGDCKAVEEVLDKDGFKRNPDGITQLAKLLDGCMQ